MADELSDYLKSISPYTRQPTAEEQAAGVPAPAPPMTVGGELSRIGRDAAVFGGAVLPGAADLGAVPARIGYDIAGETPPSWLEEKNIENYLTPQGLLARNPEEQKAAAAGRGFGAALPLALFPPTRPYAMRAALGGSVGGLAGETAQQAFPDQPWVGPVVGAVTGMASGMAPEVLSNPMGFYNSLRRASGAIDLGLIRTIAIEHSAQAAGNWVATTLGMPSAGPAIGAALHFSPIFFPMTLNLARRILGAPGAIPGGLFGAGAGSTADGTPPPQSNIIPP